MLIPSFALAVSMTPFPLIWPFTIQHFLLGFSSPCPLVAKIISFNKHLLCIYKKLMNKLMNAWMHFNMISNDFLQWQNLRLFSEYLIIINNNNNNNNNKHYWVLARHWGKHFICIISFNIYNNSMRQILLILHLKNEETEACRY